MCDGQGKVISVNEAPERLNGIKAADVVGKNVAELVKMDLLDRSVTLEVLETKRQVSLMQYAVEGRRPTIRVHQREGRADEEAALEAPSRGEMPAQPGVTAEKSHHARHPIARPLHGLRMTFKNWLAKIIAETRGKE